MTKREILSKKLDELLKYSEEEKFPFHSKIEEMVKNYKIKNMVGFCEYLIQPYNVKLLSEYIDQELKRYEVISKVMGLEPVHFSDDQKTYLIGQIEETIEIIQK